MTGGRIAPREVCGADIVSGLGPSKAGTVRQVIRHVSSMKLTHTTISISSAEPKLIPLG